MNQWPADVTGLGEYHRPFLEFVVSLQPTGEKFARFLKLDGFCFAHNVDCWKETYYVGNVPEYSASLMNGAWACAHLMDSYRFTGDKAFLKNPFPFWNPTPGSSCPGSRKTGKGAISPVRELLRKTSSESWTRQEKNQPFRLQRLFP